MIGCIKQYYRHPFKLLCCLWGWVLDLWLVLKVCRFSVFSLLVGFIFFGLAPQGIDILRAMTETGHGHVLSFIVFYLCIWLWALSIWYWARYILRFERIYRRATASDNQARVKRMVEEVPRVLGGLAFWSLWFAFLKSGRLYSDAVQDQLAINPKLFAYIYFFSGILIYLFAKFRRLLLGRMLQLPNSELLHQNFINKFSEMSRTARIFAVVIVVISIIAFLWTTFDPVSAAVLGTANLLLIAAANWVFIGTVLVLYAEKFRLPIFLILLILAVFFSAVNDNHIMRTTGPIAQDNRSSIDLHFAAWFTPRFSHWQKDPATANKPFPLFLVAAEGGGIRAAFWTASVLAALQDANNEFADHVYAMSGVSGGSLGIATFAAMLKARQAQAPFTESCKKDQQFSYLTCSQAFLQNDFLAPAAGRMLYGDLIQRFLPFPVTTFDRATALEQGWETSWKKLTGTDYFNEPFLQLYTGEKDIPVLLLNGTWVEKGYRTLSSNVQQDRHFLTVMDLYQQTGQELRLSTAVHNSARFTYVSPAATVTNAQGKIWGHVVDGGYFENSGTTTLAEVYQAIRRTTGERWRSVRPIVLMLTNDPEQDDQAQVHATPLVNEVLSPIHAMLNTRSGRGSLARSKMRQLMDKRGVFKEFGLQNVDGPVPLGWMLSQAAMQTMNKRLSCYLDELKDHNPLNIESGQTCNRTSD